MDDDLFSPSGPHPSSSGMIRDSIRDTVDSLLWLESVGQQQIENKRKLAASATSERCLVCTLPLGTCEHTEAWLMQHEKDVLVAGLGREMDAEIDDLLDVLSFQPQTLTVAAAEDIDLDHMQWAPLEEVLSDKIGATPAKLFVPDGRAFHSTTLLAADNGSNLVMVFGGLTSSQSTPQPFASSLAVTLLADLRVYEVAARCWRGIRAIGPCPRYGHCATALSGDRLLIYGGRAENNRLLSDIWVYSILSDCWQCIDPFQVPDPDPGPLPRFHADCLAITHKEEVVYLFGGTDGVHLLDDLWLLHVPPAGVAGFFWERGVGQGTSPSGRYGHRLTYSSTHQMVLLTGGCTVPPGDEAVGSTASTLSSMHLMALANTLTEAYRKESDLAVIATSSLSLHAEDMQAADLAAVYREAGQVAGLLHMREQDTRLAEQALMDAVKRSQAVIACGSKVHRENKHLETYCLRVEGEDLMWQKPLFPGERGQRPAPRIFHGVAAIGDYLFLMGGAVPSSLALQHVDTMAVYVLDLKTFVWKIHQPINSLSLQRDLLKLAEKDVINANRKAEEARIVARALGVPRSQQTKEQALAEALVNVCIWRRETLFKSLHTHATDTSSATSLRDFIYGHTDEQPQAVQHVITPSARLGCTLTAVRQRLFLVGGFPTTCQYEIQQPFQYRTMVLDVEMDLERRRRMQEEHHRALETERIKLEQDANMSALISEHDLREFIEAERRNRDRELALMARMDFLSSLPPLSRPGHVHLIQGNRHTLWMKWDKIHRDTRNKLVKEDDVVYFLYVKVGYENLCQDARVLVLAPKMDTEVPRCATLGLGLGLGLHMFASQTKPSKKKNRSRRSMTAGPMDLLMVFDDHQTRFRGQVVKVHGDGTFDVKYDDGAIESRVARYRMRLEAAPTAFPSRPASVASAASASASLDGDCDSDDGSALTINTNTFTAGSSVSKHIRRKQQKREMHLQALDHKFRQPILQQTHAMPSDLLRRNSAVAKPKTHPYYRLLVSDGSRPEEEEEEPAVTGRDDNSEPSHDASCIRHAVDVHTGQGSGLEMPTVQVTEDWRLVYVGAHNTYACTNLVPDHILLQEHGLKIPVIACVQALGLDYPRYERSQLSAPQVFFTLSAEEAGMPPEPADDRSAASSQSVNSTVIGTGTSRTRREIITAVLADQQIARIERRAESCFAEGLGDHFL